VWLLSRMIMWMVSTSKCPFLMMMMMMMGRELTADT
jgi:hypothetical protein